VYGDMPVRGQTAQGLRGFLAGEGRGALTARSAEIGEGEEEGDEVK